jgi:hypothetical protein
VFCERPCGVSHAAAGSAEADPSLLKAAPRCWTSMGADEREQRAVGVPGAPANPPNGTGDVMIGADGPPGAGCCVVCAGAGDVSVVGAAGERASGGGVVAVAVPVGAGAVVVPVGAGVVVVCGVVVVVVGAGVVGVVVGAGAGGGVVLVVAVSACAAGGAGASLAAGFGGAGSCAAETAVSSAPAGNRLPPNATAMTPAVHRPAASRLRLGRLLGVMSGGLLAMACACRPAEATVLPSAFAGTSVTAQPPASIDNPGG